MAICPGQGGVGPSGALSREDGAAVWWLGIPPGDLWDSRVGMGGGSRFTWQWWGRLSVGAWTVVEEECGPSCQR